MFSKAMEKSIPCKDCIYIQYLIWLTLAKQKKKNMLAAYF